MEQANLLALSWEGFEPGFEPVQHTHVDSQKSPSQGRQGPGLQSLRPTGQPGA